MADKDTDTNGGLPPKISLKPKSAEPKESSVSNTGASEKPASGNAPGSIFKKPLSSAPAPKPVSPASPILKTSLSKAAQETPNDSTQETKTPEPPKAEQSLDKPKPPTVAPKPILKTALSKPTVQKKAPEEKAAETDTKTELNAQDKPKSAAPTPILQKPIAKTAATESTADKIKQDIENKEEGKEVEKQEDKTPEPPKAEQSLDKPNPPTVAPKPILKPTLTKPSPKPVGDDSVASPKETKEEDPSSKPLDQQSEIANKKDTPPSSPTTSKRPVLRPVSSSSGAVKMPAPLGIKKTAADPLAAPGTKKSTSRITLPSSDGKSTTGEIKTIKIAPKSQKPSMETGKIADSDEVKDAPQPAKADPKRQTSRISLESALGSEKESSPSAPATIKIKRVPKKQSEIKTQVKSPSTAQPDAESTEKEATAPESQKKTLRVKRPSVSTGNKPSVAAGGPPSVLGGPPVPATLTYSEPTPHWFFAITALAATIVAGVLLYVFSAQVFEPDIVELRPAEERMTWPGRINL